MNQSVDIDATGNVINEARAAPTVFKDGTTALALAFSVDNADIKTVENGAIDAKGAPANTFSPDPSNSANTTINGVDYTNSTIRINGNGFTDGEAVNYSERRRQHRGHRRAYQHQFQPQRRPVLRAGRQRQRFPARPGAHDCSWHVHAPRRRPVPQANSRHARPGRLQRLGRQHDRGNDHDRQPQWPHKRRDRQLRRVVRRHAADRPGRRARRERRQHEQRPDHRPFRQLPERRIGVLPARLRERGARDAGCEPRLRRRGRGRHHDHAGRPGQQRIPRELCFWAGQQRTGKRRLHARPPGTRGELPLHRPGQRELRHPARPVEQQRPGGVYQPGERRFGPRIPDGHPVLQSEHRRQQQQHDHGSLHRRVRHRRRRALFHRSDDCGPASERPDRDRLQPADRARQCHDLRARRRPDRRRPSRRRRRLDLYRREHRERERG